MSTPLPDAVVPTCEAVSAVLADLPAGSLLVVRALPAAAEASYDELARDLRHGLDRARRTSRVGADR